MRIAAMRTVSRAATPKLTKTLPALCLLVITAASPFAAQAQIFVIDFAATVATYSPGTFAQPGFGVGSLVNGHIEVDLTILPPPTLYPGNLANYNYWTFSGPPANYFLGTLPGLTMQVTMGNETLSYDSRTLPYSSGTVPGVSLGDQDGYDRFCVALRDGTRGLALNLFDLGSPTSLVSGLSFPASIDLASRTFHPGDGQDSANFLWFDSATSETMVRADATSVSFQIIPEPSGCLLLGLSSIGIAMRRTRPPLGS
jgi:hypothetical protein